MAYQYKVNNVVLPMPDLGAEYTEEDMHGKSWRDGAGVMHLVVLRRGVKKVTLKWSWLSDSEMNTLRNACRTDMTGVYTFTDITDGTMTVYTGADLKYKKKTVSSSGSVDYREVSLSFIEM